MKNKIVNTFYGDVPIITNDSKSKKLILYMHGLDGSASISKPLFKDLQEYKIVAMESRGHNKSPIPASRSIKKHLIDYLGVIDHFRKRGYKVWLLGESMGAAYATYIAYKNPNIIEGVFAQSIPNKLSNIMVAPKIKQFKIQFMTFISFFTNINYKYKTTINYAKLSNNKSLMRVARIADKTKIRNVRETLATWKITKKAWKLLSKKKPIKKIYYFQPKEDVIVNIKKVNKNLKNAVNIEYVLIKDAKHILMYEPQFKNVISKIKQVLK